MSINTYLFFKILLKLWVVTCFFPIPNYLLVSELKGVFFLAAPEYRFIWSVKGFSLGTLGLRSLRLTRKVLELFNQQNFGLSHVPMKQSFVKHFGDTSIVLSNVLFCICKLDQNFLQFTSFPTISTTEYNYYTTRLYSLGEFIF